MAASSLSAVPLVPPVEIHVCGAKSESLPETASYAAAQVARAVRDGRPLPPSVPYGELKQRLIDYENLWSTK